MDYFKRYFALVDSSGRHIGHNIVSVEQIKKLVSSFPDYEVHLSIMRYDDHCNPIGMPLAFDIDVDGNLLEAQSLTISITTQLSRMGLHSKVWFSGNKGFHIEVPKIIFASDANLICKAIQLYAFKHKYIDSQIYRSFGLLRAIGSINNKTKLYKTEINIYDDIETIKNNSRVKKNIVYEYEYDNILNIEMLIEDSRMVYESLIYTGNNLITNYKYESTPCLSKMWEDTNPPRELWHKIIYTIAKDFINNGIDESEAIKMFDGHEFWGNINQCGYTRISYVKTIKSLFRTGMTALGCKGSGISSEAMLNYCSDICWFKDGLELEDMISGIRKNKM